MAEAARTPKDPNPYQPPTSSGEAPAADPGKFPRTFYYANAIELFERLAFYGTFVGLSLYLSNVVGYDDKDSGSVLGNFRLVSALAPIVCGAIADRITFKRSLMIAFTLYSAGYAALFAFPVKSLAPYAL